MSRINNGCPPLDPNCNNGITCNCVTGTPLIVHGNCTCINPVPVTLPQPPKPTTALPVGYEWVWNEGLGRWIPQRVQIAAINPNPIQNILGQDNILTKTIAWAKANPVVAVGLGISAYVAFFKKGK